MFRYPDGISLAAGEHEATAYADPRRFGDWREVKSLATPYTAAREVNCQSARAGRKWGIVATVLIHAIAVGVWFLSDISRFSEPVRPPAMAVVVLPSRPAPGDEVPVDPVEREQDAPKLPAAMARADAHIAPLATKAMPERAPGPSSASGPIAIVAPGPAPDLPPPPSLAALTPPQIGQDAGPDSWEGRILAMLDAHKRYPRSAQVRHQQGIAMVRFTIDRDGILQSARLEKSSGVPDLDHEALALLKRASPYPKPPANRPGERIDLVAPVEFFLR